mgnify:CR=1 FL=1
MSSLTDSYELQQEAVEQICASRDKIKRELSKVIVGQDEAINQLLISLFSGGHCLLTGPPGLAKTLLVHSISQIFRLKFRRIQFTPDLMPADVVGSEVVEESGGNRKLKFVKGPIFTNILLADEINRTPPKTQSSLLEAMEEKQVTAAGTTYPVAAPFFVLATQNPIELEGTYPLPEAQLDRFMFNIMIDYLPEAEEIKVVTKTTGEPAKEITQVVSGKEILRYQELVKKIPANEEIVRYAVQLTGSTRPGEAKQDFINEWVRYGASLRASQFMVLGGKVRALLKGRYTVSTEDIQALAKPVLRHRILTNFHAESEGITPEDIVDRLLKAVPPPQSGL